MNCSDHQCGCDQGRNCPVRAARNSGVCCTEPDPATTANALVYWGAVAAFCTVGIAVLCGLVGYVWAKHLLG